MPDKQRKRGAVVKPLNVPQRSEQQPNANEENQPSEAPMPSPVQVATQNGVPLAPDQLYEVSEGLHMNLMDIQMQIKVLQNTISEKAHAAALALGANPKSQIVLSNDMRFLAVYYHTSIEKADREAAEEMRRQAEEAEKNLVQDPPADVETTPGE